MQGCLGHIPFIHRVHTMALSAGMIFTGWLSAYLWSPICHIAHLVSWILFVAALRHINMSLIAAERLCLHLNDMAAMSVRS
jgi:hypothetical protein